MENLLKEKVLSHLGRDWSTESRKHTIAAIIVILGFYLLPTIYLMAKDQPLGAEDYLFYLSIYCPLNIVFILILLRVLCQERFWDLNFGSGRVSTELAGTFLLSVMILLCNIFLQRLLVLFLPDPSGTNIRDLFLEMSERPGRLFAFIGPMLLMGAAAEELTRVFLLSRLWKLMRSKQGKLLAVLFTSLLFGLLHISRGIVHVIWAGTVGLILGLYYLRFGRVLPLLLAHYLTNAIQVMLVVLIFGSS